MNETELEDIGRNNDHAVSLYGQSEAMDDFPVLKAFQQYIDAEQAKSRKRLVSMAIFFGILMAGVIAVFLTMLMTISERNQSLNDRMIEYAMKDRDRQSAPVVVQPPVQQDNAAILSLTTKIEEMQKKLMESQRKVEEAERAQQAALASVAPKPPSAEQLEIQRLRALLDVQKELKAAEKARQKELELEAYRRKHYPELYREKDEEEVPVRVVQPQVKQNKPKTRRVEEPENIDDILNDSNAVTYFDEEPEEDSSVPRKPAKTERRPASPSRGETPPSEQAAPVKSVEAMSVETQPELTVPVEVKGTTSSWRIPNE